MTFAPDTKNTHSPRDNCLPPLLSKAKPSYDTRGKRGTTARPSEVSGEEVVEDNSTDGRQQYDDSLLRICRLMAPKTGFPPNRLSVVNVLFCRMIFSRTTYLQAFAWNLNAHSPWKMHCAYGRAKVIKLTNTPTVAPFALVVNDCNWSATIPEYNPMGVRSCPHSPA